jgi:predicted naringenin-chalcone synthase
MGLKQEVPEFIKQHVPDFVRQMLPEGVRFQDCEWPVHPGGKSILKSIEEACGLAPVQTEASWNVLANYGNMSSSTFLFVLHELLRKPSIKEWAVGLGFGPGLTIEGILLQSCRGSDA